MRLHRWEKLLLIVPLMAAIAATILYVIQGGFGAGHGRFDRAIYLLGLPSILWSGYLWPATDKTVSDWFVLIVLPPAVMNLLLVIFVTIGVRILVRGAGSRPKE